MERRKGNVKAAFKPGETDIGIDMNAFYVERHGVYRPIKKLTKERYREILDRTKPVCISIPPDGITLDYTGHIEFNWTDYAVYVKGGIALILVDWGDVEIRKDGDRRRYCSEGVKVFPRQFSQT